MVIIKKSRYSKNLVWSWRHALIPSQLQISINIQTKTQEIPPPKIKKPKLNTPPPPIRFDLAFQTKRIKPIYIPLYLQRKVNVLRMSFKKQLLVQQLIWEWTECVGLNHYITLLGPILISLPWRQISKPKLDEDIFC